MSIDELALAEIAWADENLCNECYDDAIFIRYCKLCVSCYHRWCRNRYKKDADGTPIVPIKNRKKTFAEAMYEEYLWLLDHGWATASHPQIAAKLNVSRRTVDRWSSRRTRESLETVNEAG